jgi:hypothetical protein
MAELTAVGGQNAEVSVLLDPTLAISPDPTAWAPERLRCRDPRTFLAGHV